MCPAPPVIRTFIYPFARSLIDIFIGRLAEPFSAAPGKICSMCFKHRQKEVEKGEIVTPHRTIKVIMVCTGNICRSPMAEAVFRNLVHEAGLDGQIEVESAGTTSYHTGQATHPGTVKVLKQHGIAH